MESQGLRFYLVWLMLKYGFVLIESELPSWCMLRFL